MKGNWEYDPQWLWNESAKAADEWYRLQCRDIYASLYLYYRRGELRIAGDCPPGFELGSGRRIGPGSTKDMVKQWIYETSRRLPCLPYCAEEEVPA